MSVSLHGHAHSCYFIMSKIRINFNAIDWATVVLDVLEVFIKVGPYLLPPRRMIRFQALLSGNAQPIASDPNGRQLGMARSDGAGPPITRCQPDLRSAPLRLFVECRRRRPAACNRSNIAIAALRCVRGDYAINGALFSHSRDFRVANQYHCH